MKKHPHKRAIDIKQRKVLSGYNLAWWRKPSSVKTCPLLDNAGIYQHDISYYNEADVRNRRRDKEKDEMAKAICRECPLPHCVFDYTGEITEKDLEIFRKYVEVSK